MRRVLAMVAAAAMVAGSIALRARLDRNEEEKSTELRLVCSTELAAVCDTLRDSDDAKVSASVEAAGVTADRLAGVETDPGLDGWLVSAPWPEIVDGRRRSAARLPLFESTGPALARSPLVLVVARERAAVLRARCGGEVGWKCIGDAAVVGGGWAAIGGRPEWGPVKVGTGDPVSDGIGMQVIGQATAAFFGRTDLSTIDLDSDDFRRWFTGLAGAARPDPSPLTQMLVTGPAAFDAVGTSEAEAGPLLARSARRDIVDLLYPSPMATADAVVATTGERGSRLRDVASGERARRALAQAGWRVPGQPNAPGVPTTPPLGAASDLPPSGLLDALRQQWREASGR